MPYPSFAFTTNKPVFASKLGGQKLDAPPSSGATSTPSLLGSFAGSGIGRPCASSSLLQLTAANGLVSRLLPLVLSRTKKYPLRDACNSILRGCPLNSPSTSTGTSAASQSCVSCGET